MYIKSMVIEGFKSYGKRVEINGFDREFNAITGLNGSGKSNILDAICFVLGISNLTHVRASGFQDLVYKNGQAGVTKASVTIIFDNTDKEHCPIGYEQHKEITITRQVVIGGKNKYMINGTNCLNKRVQDLFCSVQLNVNNPHFLIMQGRITKVLNMKPPEILSMIEEAAGTSMYEVKRMSTRSTIERKDIKMKELSSVVKEEIAPKLEKMKTERQQVMEYNKIQRELDLLTRLYVAWRYVSAEETAEKAKIQVQQVHDKIAETRQKIVDGATEVEELNKLVQELQSKVDSEKGGVLETLEKQLKEKDKLEAKALANQKNLKDTVASEEKNKKQLAKSLKEDEAALASKESELRKVQGLFDKLKSAQEEDKVALEAAQRKFQAVSSGLLSADDGTNATLEDQLMNAKQAVAQAQTEKKQAEMQLAPCQKELREKEQEMKKTSSNYEGDRQKLENMERELKTLEKELSKLNYKDGHIEDLQEQKRRLSQEIRSLKYQLDNSKSRNPHLNFVYRDPETNFNRASVKGLVCRLVKVKQPQTARALEVAAGGKLYNVIVDTEVTSKKLLKRGQLQRRTTIIPLNKISGHSMNQNTIRTAEQLVGKDNVQPALSLIDYDRELRPAMEWIFGQVFICRDMATARKVTFHERIMKKSVTLDGDSVDPGGTLSGGAAAKGPNVFEEVNKLKEPEEALARKELELAVVDQEITNLAKVAERFNSLKERLDLRKHEVELVRQKLQQTSHHRYQEEVDNLKESIAKLGKKVVECTNTVAGNQHKVNDLEAKLKNVKALKETQLQTAKNEMVRLEKKAEESSKQWKQREQDFESLNLEIKELQTSIETSRSQIAALEEKLVELKAQTEQNQADLDKAKTEVLEIKEVIKKQKELINHQNKEIQHKIQKKDKLVKNSSEYELEIKKMEYEIAKLRNESDNSHHKVKQLSEKYEWIEREKAYFGKPNGMYDFAENNPEEAGKRIQKLKENLEKMGRTLNMRALANLGTVEDQYQDLLKKKKIVETDREKIVNVIDELDERKKVALREACKKVNQDFGSIFSVLLPGAKACLRPLEGKDVLEGLEVKVGFGDVWKESLGELSGGQRSLVALSLILAMLLFKPAPLYILDEVDAALDLSHTQNIGNMLRSHFRHSQFIVVSLKDGMFNNANVLFRTKFVDGMSTVQRSVQHVVPRPLSSLDNKRNH